MRYLKYFLLMWALGAGLLLRAVEVDILELRQPNLIKNPGFSNPQRPRWLPEHWTFENCSQKAGFEYNFKNGEAYLFTSGRLFGYMLQSGIPVEEGKRYYVSAKVKLTTTTLMWVRTTDYHDGLDSQNHPRSNTNLFACLLRPEQGKELFDELQYFIDPSLLLKFGDKEWTLCDSEFTVPKGKGVKTYAFRIGSLGGGEGWIRVTEPVLRLAERDLTVTVRGEKCRELVLCHSNGVVMERHKLDPAAAVQKVKLLLPSTIAGYYIEIFDNDGQKYRRSL